MKKSIIVIIVLLLFCVSFAVAESIAADDWADAPIFIKAYEQSSGKIYIEWKGNAPLYQVHVDGKKTADVAVPYIVIDASKSTHNIVVYPICEIKSANGSRISLELGLPDFLRSITDSSSGLSLDIDLSAFGLEAKDIILGAPSAPLNIDYKTNPIINGSAVDLSTSTDFNNMVIITFSDQFNADEYEIMIKKGKNFGYATYRTNNQTDATYITKDRSMVSIVLDPDFIAKQDCLVPELDEQYKFSVLMRKYTTDYISGQKIQTVILPSKQSKEITYVPVAPWKTAPLINYASQTADGQVTLRWSHDDGGLGCIYQIMQINQTLGIKTKETKLATVKENEFVFHDLANGKYTLAVVPELSGKTGNLSSTVTIEVKNNWYAAPSLTCKQFGRNQVKLTWTKADNIDYYCCKVYVASNNALLRFVDLDYKPYSEFTIPADNSDIEHLFTYESERIPEAGIKLKFEIYGIHVAADGQEQKTAVTNQSITLH